MKTLEEKKLLVKMMKAFGQPVDQELVESIRREEEFAKLLFKEEKKEVVVEQQVILKEADPEPLPVQPEKPAETNIQPPEDYKVQQVANYLNTVSKAKKPPLVTALQDNEFEALRKTVMDLLNKVNTLSWGGGGTGAVRINDQDDFDQTSYAEGRYLRWKNGMFRLDEIAAGDINNNTTVVTDDEYYVLDDDWYIGVNYPGTVTIYLPVTADDGRNLVIKDESGNCANNPIIANGTVDNDAGGFNLQINNGAIHMVYRSGWRII